ncbi:3-deoxy-manno-octulosonate cytidylyltransferase [Acetobacter conturbans]|uniref:3-deoxy-manno-octulosonate cytidylyltransferase n=1 Tax=Acetobacter conturbans TaxID=1737472 RepID=A0ABX0JYD6_9PROT|nr:3-deoxy-manno-octulosonate cytidylyltransferase [Acetobacter conturbans]NHN88020.1 3-deoxy-manno-octulosonate cytidylyltransferase [Acetobacter conturbans]
MISPLVIIPARMASSRLPGKPMAEIAGRPMILHVLERAQAASAGRVVVAAAEQEIVDIVRRAGGEAVLTEPDLASGSDRVHAAMLQVDPTAKHDVIINLQGDLPGLDPSTLQAALLPLSDAATDIGTLVAPIRDDREASAESVVKVACAFPSEATQIARALYFSRACIPWGEGPLWHHIGVYAWRRTALERFVSLPASPLERRERLEQLRALEAGMIIGCARVAEAPFGVDTPADLERARRILGKQS